MTEEAESAFADSFRTLTKHLQHGFQSGNLVSVPKHVASLFKSSVVPPDTESSLLRPVAKLLETRNNAMRLAPSGLVYLTSILMAFPPSLAQERILHTIMSIISSYTKVDAAAKTLSRLLSEDIDATKVQDRRRYIARKLLPKAIAIVVNAQKEMRMRRLAAQFAVCLLHNNQSAAEVAVAHKECGSLSSLLAETGDYVLRLLVANVLRSLLYDGCISPDQLGITNSPVVKIRSFYGSERCDAAWIDRILDFLSELDSERAFSQNLQRIFRVCLVDFGSYSYSTTQASIIVRVAETIVFVVPNGSGSTISDLDIIEVPILGSLKATMQHSTRLEDDTSPIDAATAKWPVELQFGHEQGYTTCQGVKSAVNAPIVVIFTSEEESADFEEKISSQTKGLGDETHSNITTMSSRQQRYASHLIDISYSSDEDQDTDRPPSSAHSDAQSSSREPDVESPLRKHQKISHVSRAPTEDACTSDELPSDIVQVLSNDVQSYPERIRSSQEESALLHPGSSTRGLVHREGLLTQHGNKRKVDFAVKSPQQAPSSDVAETSGRNDKPHPQAFKSSKSISRAPDTTKASAAIDSISQNPVHDPTAFDPCSLPKTHVSTIGTQNSQRPEQPPQNKNNTGSTNTKVDMARLAGKSKTLPKKGPDTPAVDSGLPPQRQKPASKKDTNVDWDLAEMDDNDGHDNEVQISMVQSKKRGATKAPQKELGSSAKRRKATTTTKPACKTKPNTTTKNVPRQKPETQKTTDIPTLATTRGRRSKAITSAKYVESTDSDDEADEVVGEEDASEKAHESTEEDHEGPKRQVKSMTKQKTDTAADLTSVASKARRVVHTLLATKNGTSSSAPDGESAEAVNNPTLYVPPISSGHGQEYRKVHAQDDAQPQQVGAELSVSKAAERSQHTYSTPTGGSNRNTAQEQGSRSEHDGDETAEDSYPQDLNAALARGNPKLSFGSALSEMVQQIPLGNASSFVASVNAAKATSTGDSSPKAAAAHQPGNTSTTRDQPTQGSIAKGPINAISAVEQLSHKADMIRSAPTAESCPALEADDNLEAEVNEVAEEDAKAERVAVRPSTRAMFSSIQEDGFAISRTSNDEDGVITVEDADPDVDDWSKQALPATKAQFSFEAEVTRTHEGSTGPGPLSSTTSVEKRQVFSQNETSMTEAAVSADDNHAVDNSARPEIYKASVGIDVERSEQKDQESNRRALLEQQFNTTKEKWIITHEHEQHRTTPHVLKRNVDLTKKQPEVPVDKVSTTVQHMHIGLPALANPKTPTAAPVKTPRSAPQLPNRGESSAHQPMRSKALGIDQGLRSSFQPSAAKTSTPLSNSTNVLQAQSIQKDDTVTRKPRVVRWGKHGPENQGVPSLQIGTRKSTGSIRDSSATAKHEASKKRLSEPIIKRRDPVDFQQNRGTAALATHSALNEEEFRKQDDNPQDQDVVVGKKPTNELKNDENGSSFPSNNGVEDLLHHDDIIAEEEPNTPDEDNDSSFHDEDSESEYEDANAPDISPPPAATPAKLRRTALLEPTLLPPSFGSPQPLPTKTHISSRSNQLAQNRSSIGLNSELDRLHPQASRDMNMQAFKQPNFSTTQAQPKTFMRLVTDAVDDMHDGVVENDPILGYGTGHETLRGGIKATATVKRMSLQADDKASMAPPKTAVSSRMLVQGQSAVPRGEYFSRRSRQMPLAPKPIRPQATGMTNNSFDAPVRIRAGELLHTENEPKVDLTCSGGTPQSFTTRLRNSDEAHARIFSSRRPVPTFDGDTTLVNDGNVVRSDVPNTSHFPRFRSTSICSEESVIEETEQTTPAAVADVLDQSRWQPMRRPTCRTLFSQIVDVADSAIVHLGVAEDAVQAKASEFDRGASSIIETLTNSWKERLCHERRMLSELICANRHNLQATYADMAEQARAYDGKNVAQELDLIAESINRRQRDLLSDIESLHATMKI